MAIISIRNAEVTRTFWNGKGAGIKESFQKKDGTEGAAYYSAFFEEEHGLSEGDRGNFSGLLGTKVSEYTDKQGETRQGVDITLNSARYEAGDGGAPTDDSDAPF